MVLTGITGYRRNGELYVKVDGWPHGAGHRARAYVCSCNICEDHRNADWSDGIHGRIVSRCADRNGARKGRVLYLVDYALGGFRPVAALTYHVTPRDVLQVLAAGATERVLLVDVDRYIATLLVCADAIAIKTGLKNRIEWLCADEDQADDICELHDFASGRRLARGQVVVRRSIEAD